eukprot:1816439-Prymnesium_polylepis.1
MEALTKRSLTPRSKRHGRPSVARPSLPRDQREPSRLIDKEERDELDRALDRTDTIQHAKRRLKVKLELLHHEPYL